MEDRSGRRLDSTTSSTTRGLNGFTYRGRHFSRYWARNSTTRTIKSFRFAATTYGRRQHPRWLQIRQLFGRQAQAVAHRFLLDSDSFCDLTDFIVSQDFDKRDAGASAATRDPRHRARLPPFSNRLHRCASTSVFRNCRRGPAPPTPTWIENEHAQLPLLDGIVIRIETLVTFADAGPRCPRRRSFFIWQFVDGRLSIACEHR